ncbi:MAG: hypothetical protein WAN86_09635 [Hyphomicrobiaceae bacterium]
MEKGLAVAKGPSMRREHLARLTGRVIVPGLIMDAIHRLETLGTFYPGEAVIVALLLAFVPYLPIRGPAARVARRWSRSASNTAQ